MLVAVLAVTVTLASWAFLPSSIAGGDLPDYVISYEPAARHLAEGRGLVDGVGRPATRYPPGFPLLLAGAFVVAEWTGIDERVLVFAELLLLAVAAALLVFALARRLWGVDRAVFAAAMWLTFPLTVWTWRHPASEPAFIPVVLLAVLVFWRGLARPSPAVGPDAAALFLAGLLVGGATLIRPAALGLGVVLAVFVWFAGGGRRPARVRMLLVAALLAGNLLALAPWEAWMLARTGRVVLVSTNGVPSIRDGLTFAIDDKGYRTAVWVPEGARSVMRQIGERSDADTSLAALGAALAGQVAANPVGVVEFAALKVARSWYATDSGRLEGALLVMQLLYLPLVALASVRAWRRGDEARRFTGLAWLVAVYFWLMTVMVVSIVRYMLPAMALLFVLLGGLPPSALPIGERVRTITGRSGQRAAKT